MSAGIPGVPVDPPHEVAARADTTPPRVDRRESGRRFGTVSTASVTHRSVSANGIRFHLAEAGSGSLVLLLHGFGGLWTNWRHQLSGIAAAGFHVVAADLRGAGETDKPPRGYDAFTLAADVAGLVRAFGERDATSGRTGLRRGACLQHRCHVSGSGPIRGGHRRAAPESEWRSCDVRSARTRTGD